MSSRMVSRPKCLRLADRLLIALLLLTIGCAGGQTASSTQAEQDRAAAPFNSRELPALPVDSASRHASAEQDNTVDGSDAFDQTAGAQGSGTDMNILAAAGKLEWAIYRLATAGNPPLQVKVNLAVNSGEAWIALADYSKARWTILGPFSTDPAAIVLTAAANVSPGDNVYFAVIAFDGASLTVTDSIVTVDAAGPAPLFISGHVEDDGGTPLAGVTLFIPFKNTDADAHIEGISTITDANGDYLIEGLAADPDLRLVPSFALSATDGFSFTPNIRFIDLSVNMPGMDFVAHAETLPVAPAQVTYTSHMLPQILEPICINCHNSAYGLPPADDRRHDAPISVNWDTYNGTSENRKSVGNDLVQGDLMPGPEFGDLNLNAFQKALFQAWTDADFPQ